MIHSRIFIVLKSFKTHKISKNERKIYRNLTILINFYQVSIPDVVYIYFYFCAIRLIQLNTKKAVYAYVTRKSGVIMIINEFFPIKTYHNATIFDQFNIERFFFCTKLPIDSFRWFFVYIGVIKFYEINQSFNNITGIILRGRLRKFWISPNLYVLLKRPRENHFCLPIFSTMLKYAVSVY